jgi:hypothetical protein
MIVHETTPESRTIQRSIAHALVSIIVQRLARAADGAFGHLADTRESFAVARTDASA